MEQDIYRQVQRKMDGFSVGFPETESGVEIKILKKLLSEEDAAVFLKLSFLLEPPKKIARRLGMPETDTIEKLEDMANRGLVFCLRKEGRPYYAAVPFAHGMWEYQIKRMDKEFAELAVRFIREKMNANLKENANDFLRVVPVNQSVDGKLSIASYEDAAEILRSKDKIIVADCACRKGRDLAEGSCDKPMETCFFFGSMAQFYIDRGLGRKIDVDEALKILKECQDAGLVTSPASALNPTGMCNCCGDCCGVLVSYSELPKPAEAVFSNHFAQTNKDECTGCGDCIDRCQMSAVKLDDEGLAWVDLDRCIGCGLCVTACPTDAIFLKAKDEKDRRVPWKNGEDQMMKMGQNRGTTGQFVKDEMIVAYQGNHVFGVLDLVLRLIYKTVRMMFK